ncbi:hypothetical protein [Pseudonocardia sp.]|uniref:hypothetical protein n=1 Tax=Pseudonocardia sp. TaxID=60912 RepID=UPI003D137072
MPEIAPPIARSPISLPRNVAPVAGPTLTDLSLLAKVAVRAPATGAVRDALGVGFGRAARPAAGPLAGALVVGSGPGQWLVIGAQGATRCLRAAVDGILAATDEFATRVDVGHGWAMLRVTGATAPALLAKVCAIDLADRVTPDGAAFRSSVARVVTDVVRDDVDGARSYLVGCARSSGQYLADSLLDAGREFGLVTSAHRT